MGRWQRCTCALGVLLTAACVAAPPAAAGEYDVYGCRMPSGAEITPFAGWVDDSDGQPAGTSCGTGSAYGVAAGAAWLIGQVMSEGQGVGVRFAAPAGTHIARAELYRWFDAGEPTREGVYEYRLRADGRMLETCHTTICRQRGSRFGSPMANENRAVFDALGAQRITARIECANAGMQCGHDSPFKRPPAVAVHASRITLIDDTPPRLVVPPAGTLFDPGGPVTGERTVTFHGTDIGSGLAEVAVVIDGAPYAAQSVNPEDSLCREPFAFPVPCPLEHSRTFVFDTSVVPNGEHVMRVSLRDAAGNGVESEPFRVATRNRSSPNGARASSFARMRAWLPQRGRKLSSRAVDYGQRVPISGVLVDELGRPISGAALDIITRAQRISAPWRRAGALVTNRRGRFRAVLPPGTSRVVRIAYRAYSLDAAYAATAEASVRVRAGVRFGATPRQVRNGSTITFRGRLLGGRSRSGVTVVIYAVGRRVRGQRARVPVEAVRTDHRGRFAYRYRFQNIAGPFHYRFQAHVRRDRGYPYAPGRSGIVHVAARP